jgi:hypothetical protein
MTLPVATVSLERIYEFHCTKCHNVWTVGDGTLDLGQTIYCTNPKCDQSVEVGVTRLREQHNIYHRLQKKLYHCRCGSCESWWTHEPRPVLAVKCYACGLKNTVFKIEREEEL